MSKHIKIKARVHGCVIYWDGKNLCVHKDGDAAHHIVDSMASAIATAYCIGPVAVQPEDEGVEEDIFTLKD